MQERDEAVVRVAAERYRSATEARVVVEAWERSGERARSSVRGYLRLKDKRLRNMPGELRRFENAHERVEGTANWVGYHIVRKVLDGRR